MVAQFPTVFWWLGASDEALVVIGNAGVATSLLALLSGWRVPLFLAAVCHLSLVTVGGPFITFPWDFLLMEASVVALLLPPARTLLSLRTRGLPGPAVAFAVNHVLFKLMLGMGLQKFYQNRDECVPGCCLQVAGGSRGCVRLAAHHTPGTWRVA